MTVEQTHTLGLLLAFAYPFAVGLLAVFLPGDWRKGRGRL